MTTAELERTAVEPAAQTSDGVAAIATLRVVRGEPTPEELAALVAVIAARGSRGGEPGTAPKTSAWTDRSRYMRSIPWHAVGGWRTSAYPR